MSFKNFQRNGGEAPKELPHALAQMYAIIVKAS